MNKASTLYITPSEHIERHTRAFLDQGGTIEVVPEGRTSEGHKTRREVLFDVNGTSIYEHLLSFKGVTR